MTCARRGVCAAAVALFGLFSALPAEAVISKNRAEPARETKPKVRPKAQPEKSESKDAVGHEPRVRTTATKDRDERRVSLVRAVPEDEREPRSGKGKKDKRDTKEKKRERKIRPLPPGATWTKYRAAPWRRGYVTVQGHGKKWSGYLVDAAGDVIPAARQGISEALSSWRTGREKLMDARLLALVADVSDEFGGRPVRIVSGYREHSYAPDSKHKVGQAFDFSVPGVPNEMVRDFLKSLPDVGVGFYPNSTHVHLDVREKSCYWVDYSGPGERPQYPWQLKKQRRGIVTPAERALAAALDDIAARPLRSPRLSKIAPKEDLKEGEDVRETPRAPARPAATRLAAPDAGAPAVSDAGAADAAPDAHSGSN